MRVVNRRNEPYTHYIGRPSPLGNPFSHRSGTQAKYVVDSVETAIASFEVYARKSSAVMKRIEGLPEDAVLGCWCKPMACHGDVIVKIWEELHGRTGGIGIGMGKQKLVIDRFAGPYEFLSNFYWFTTRTGERTTVEHIYQACKCADPSESYYVLTAKTPGFAKKLGRRAKLVNGWNDNRIPAMLPILRSKFRKGTREAELLLATGDAELIEGNTWGDTFWGVYNGQGENWLGVLLMLVREELREKGS